MPVCAKRWQVVRKNTRIMVGWDASIMDWWIRAFPRLFTTRGGSMLLMGTSIIGQHLVVPLLVLAAALCVAYAKL
jgi:hypothetical protein